MSKRPEDWAAASVLPPWGCEEELGIPSEFVISVQRRAITGDFEISARAPFDMLLRGVSALALDDSNDPILAWRANIRTDMAGDWWYYTKPRGAVVPVAGIFGTLAEPFYWPAPRVVRKGETVVIKLQPDTGRTLSFVSVVFDARRLRGPEAKLYACLDPKEYGYQCLVSPAISVSAPDTAGGYGPEQDESLGIDSLPYDVLISQKGVLIVNPADGDGFSLPLVAAIVGTSEEYPTFRHKHTLGLVPSTRYGANVGSGDPGLSYRPVTAPLPACVTIHQKGAIDFRAAFLRTAGGNPSTVEVFTFLHGQRIPTEGLPGYLGWPAMDSPPGIYDPRNQPH